MYIAITNLESRSLLTHSHKLPVMNYAYGLSHLYVENENGKSPDPLLVYSTVSTSGLAHLYAQQEQLAACTTATQFTANARTDSEVDRNTEVRVHLLASLMLYL